MTMKRFLKRTVILCLILSAAWAAWRWYQGRSADGGWPSSEDIPEEAVDSTAFSLDSDRESEPSEEPAEAVAPGALFILVDEGTPSVHKEYYKVPSAKQCYVSPSHYDYSAVAARLTEGCDSDYEKIVAINDWIGRNIAYDTSYSIRTADDAFDNKKGVCQGYCELFYRIAEAAGLRTEIVTGISRDIHGNVQTGGHAWIFAYTRPDYGIFVDPTWDAGTVNGNEFTFREVRGNWFNVEPECLILTHFPENESYQLIDPLMSREEFESLEGSVNMCDEYGMDMHEIYLRARAHTLALPQMFSGGEGIVTALDIPLQSSLRAGQTYLFRVKLAKPVDFVLHSGRTVSSVLSGDWQVDGNGYYCLRFTPDSSNKTVDLGLKTNRPGGGFQTSVSVRYPVTE